MSKKSLLSIFFLLITFCATAQYPTINANRPRIVADSSRIAWLKANVLVPGDCQTTFNNIVSAYNGWWINDPQLYLLGNDSTQWTWNWNSQWADDEANLALLIYKVNNSPLELKRCRFIARQVIKTINTATFSTMSFFPKEDLLRKMSASGDVLLDWCYNVFPTQLRDSLAQALYVMSREFMTTYIYSSVGNSYVASHTVWNAIYCNQNALTLHQSAGLTLLQQDTVKQWYRFVYDKFINGFIPCWTYYRDDDGGWNWGAAYNMWSLTDQFQLFENMRIATNKNFYTDLPWVQNSINQYVYMIQPNDQSLHWGDGETRLIPDRVMFLHARYFNDVRSKWISQTIATPNTMDKYNKFLYKDFNLALVTQPALPLNWWTDKVGLSVSRSSWANNATMITFFNSPSKRAAHEHRDNNSFTIFKNKPLLIDAGYYDSYASTHYNNYYQRTIAHNSICVFDSTDAYNCFGSPASNDGGQVESAALQNYSEIFLSANQRGKWIQYASGSNYAYNIADAQLSYDSTKLNFFRRRLLYINSNKVIVLDHVRLKNRATKQRDISWLAHFAKQPVMTGSIVNTKVAGKIETFNGRDYKVTNGTGNLAIRTVLPDSIRTTRIGGAGYEYYVNGVNYLPLTAPDTSFYTPGAWRIEVRPKTVRDTVVYLHTIKVGDNTNVASAGGIALQNTVSIGTDWNDTLYYFAADAGIGKSYHYFNKVNGSRTIGIVALDMAVGAYYVKVDGTIMSSVNTDTNGIIQTTAALGAGQHLVEITKKVNTTGVDESTLQELGFTIFPNPVQSELTIAFNSEIKAYGISIYNMLGALLIESYNASKINVSSLPKGIYTIKVEVGEQSFVRKFAKE